MSLALPSIVKQFVAFFGVGVVAIIVHYGTLIGLVEGGGVEPVPAALAGYSVGGVVSYLLNRQHTFRSGRPHVEAGWRFAMVMGVGFTLTLLLMALFVEKLDLPYLPSQVVTTGIVFLWNFAAHKWWTFGR
ncbi:MAG: GtrA family protein [Beijerinckiaceae bacterium]